MKSFQQFMEQVSPKHYDKTPVTVDDAITNRIRTPDVIKRSNEKFKKGTGFNLPLAKKEYSGKINSDVLKAYPELNPDNPRDYMKLKRLSTRLKKA
jgi:hypothetical protein